MAFHRVRDRQLMIPTLDDLRARFAPEELAEISAAH